MKKTFLLLLALSLTILTPFALQSMEKEQAAIAVLPDEIMVQIFSYLASASSLDEAIKNIKAASLVNKEWQRLLSDPKLMDGIINYLAEHFGAPSLIVAVNLEMPGALGWLARYKDREGNTALMWAAAKGNAKLAKALLDKNVDSNSANVHGWTPLMVAAQNEYIDIIHLLLNKGADVNFLSKSGRTALMDAVETGNVAIVRLLLAKKPDVNIQDKQGFTALHFAVMIRSEEIIQVLLENGANPTLANIQGRTPLMMALAFGDENIAKLIQNHMKQKTEK